MGELDKCMEKCNADAFMQDGALCHMAKLIVDWFHFVVSTFWNLGPQIHQTLTPLKIWAYIKVKRKERDTSILPWLQAAIQDIWDNIDPQYLHHLADSLPKRLQKVKKAWGHPTSY